MAEGKEESLTAVLKEQDETRPGEELNFSNQVSVRLERDRHTKVIVYGPSYQAGARYEVVVRWPGHQRLTFRNVGDGSVRSLEFDPVDRTPTGNSDTVYVTVSKNGVPNPDFTGNTGLGVSRHIAWFYDHEITRDNVVTVFMVSYGE